MNIIKGNIMKPFIVTLTIALLLLGNAAEASLFKQFKWIKPYGIDYGMVDGAPDGSPVFRAGFQQGCHSGISAVGNGIYKTFYGFEFNPQMVYNQDYNIGWDLGFRHCRWYTSNFVG